jgi:hypothetical protein
MTTPAPPPNVGGVPDYLSYIFPETGRRIRRASEVSRRTREREISQYQRATGATRQQAQRRTAAARRRGQTFRTVRPERATSEQQQRAERYRRRLPPQQPGRGGPSIADTSVERAYDAMYNKIGPGSVIRVPEGYVPSETSERIITPEGNIAYTTPYSVAVQDAAIDMGWNQQIVLANVSAMTDEERYWTIYVASADDIRMRARIAAKGDNYSLRYPRYVLWYYHSDYFNGAT